MSPRVFLRHVEELTSRQGLHVISRSGVATLRTAIHLLLTYLLTYIEKMRRPSSRILARIVWPRICSPLESDPGVPWSGATA